MRPLFSSWPNASRILASIPTPRSFPQKHGWYVPRWAHNGIREIPDPGETSCLGDEFEADGLGHGMGPAVHPELRLGLFEVTANCFLAESEMGRSVL